MKNIKPASLSPNKEVIEACEDLLKEAKAGNIRGMAVATVEKDRSFVTGFEKGDAHALSLVGATAMLQQHVQKECIEE